MVFRCANCNKKVKVCPHCGEKLRLRRSGFFWLLIALLILAALPVFELILPLIR